MTEWNEQRLEELVRKMELRRTPGQGKTPIHLSLYNGSAPLLTQIMRLDEAAWSVLGYDETDRVSVVRYLGALGCRVADDSNWTALHEAFKHQNPISTDLVEALIDAGCDVNAASTGRTPLHCAAGYQQELTVPVTEILLRRGADATAVSAIGWSALFWLTAGENREANPQVVDLLLRAGCPADVESLKFIPGHGDRSRFDRIMRQYTAWKTKKLCEESAESSVVSRMDWSK